MIQTDEAYNDWIRQFKTMDKLGEQLRFILLILYSLDSKAQEHYEAEIRKFEQIFQNLKFMRKVKHRDSLIEDFSAEYFGSDKAIDDPFQYDEKLELQINNISLEIMGVLGRIIKYMKKLEITISDET